MDKLDRQTIRYIEIETGEKLSNKEKMLCLIGFRYGVIEGYNRTGKIVKKVLK